ncbi:MAG: class I SAM-dependent methyltransferase, partial [Gammaproteobacteria bacterium]
AAQKVLAHYLRQEDKILRFHTLSHFYAYIIEALVDLGETEIARRAMANIARLQKKNGAVPAYPDVKWVCIPGVMQFAVVWYKLGDLARADAAFQYALTAQNRSGGFFGSAGRKADYCPKDEVSWAVKYFLDALQWKMRAHFATAGQDASSVSLPGSIPSIARADGRVQAAIQSIRDCQPSSIIELGCGKGRITRFIKEAFPNAQVCGMDISARNLDDFPKDIQTVTGSLLATPLADASFDFALIVETLEHAVDVENAIRETMRILRPGGTLLVVDKNLHSPVFMKMSSWEQWFVPAELAKTFLRAGFTTVRMRKDIPYDENDGSNGLFFAMSGRKPG